MSSARVPATETLDVAAGQFVLCLTVAKQEQMDWAQSVQNSSVDRNKNYDIDIMIRLQQSMSFILDFDNVIKAFV